MPKAIKTPEHRWLNSDSQILGRVRQEARKNGHFVHLLMPWDEDFTAQVEKWDANTAITFCEMARNLYHERKEEQKAAQASKAALRERESEKLTSCEDSVSAPKETPQDAKLDLTDRASISRRVDTIRDREAAIVAEAGKLRVERTKLLRILEVLDAPEDDDEELPSVHTEMPSRPGGQDGMDRGACEITIHSSGAEGDGGADPEQQGVLDALPDGEPESS